MPRPRKNSEDLKAYHLRVPLTVAQLALIEEAAKLDDDGKAGWARAILLAAAKKRIEKANARKSESDSI